VSFFITLKLIASDKGLESEKQIRPLFWIIDNDKYNTGDPGIGMEVARWLAAGGVGVTGADTWPVEVNPNPDPDCAFCVHAFLQPRHGIVNQENLTLSALAAQKVYQFAIHLSQSRCNGIHRFTNRGVVNVAVV
jgi:hypothetical protein